MALPVYYEDDEHDPEPDWADDPNFDYEEGYYEDEAYSQDKILRQRQLTAMSTRPMRTCCLLPDPCRSGSN